MSDKADIAVVGMAVMGQNLALNIASRKYKAAVFNRTAERTQQVMQERGNAAGLVATYSARELARALKRPRRLILLVKAGQGVDDTIAHLLPHLDRGDIVIDGGNSHYPDTERRQADLAKKGIRFIGSGVSGGEEGALHGPSIMPGGDRDAYRHVDPIFRAIAAKTEDGACCTWLGTGSAGHFVKMVHNGIEYAMMQMLAESYDLMRTGLGYGMPEVHREFTAWNTGRTAGYLVEISGIVTGTMDPETGKPLVDLIVDSAAQKGTGKWTTNAALDFGVPVPSITAAVDARILSGHKTDRVAIARVMPTRSRRLKGVSARRIEGAAYAGFLAAYAQGMHLLVRASAEKGYGLKLAEVARIWKGGCIIRSRILHILKQAYSANPSLPHLLYSPVFRRALAPALPDLRAAVGAASSAAIPVPGLSSALAYFDTLGRDRLPANLTQAQRDHFGAHTYQRTDRPGTFHSHWG